MWGNGFYFPVEDSDLLEFQAPNPDLLALAELLFLLLMCRRPDRSHLFLAKGVLGFFLSFFLKSTLKLKCNSSWISHDNDPFLPLYLHLFCWGSSSQHPDLLSWFHLHSFLESYNSVRMWDEMHFTDTHSINLWFNPVWLQLDTPKKMKVGLWAWLIIPGRKPWLMYVLPCGFYQAG